MNSQRILLRCGVPQLRVGPCGERVWLSDCRVLC